jgi:NADH-quinone oxidoreductase subunit G
VSAATAESLGVVDGDTVTVSANGGSVTAPVEVAQGMVDHVVWLPTNSGTSTVRASLRAGGGAIVTVAKAPSTVEVTR